MGRHWAGIGQALGRYWVGIGQAALLIVENVAAVSDRGGDA